MMSQPFYHLRPNKYVDRCLFVNALERLNSQVKLQKHRYIGFGSYLFDDFKLLHDRLNIGTMISLESDSTIFKRAEFNAPYKCISVINQTSTDYISGDNWGEQNSIIWLDYVTPRTLGQQFSDIATLSNTILPCDVLKVTFNANADTLGKAENGMDARLEKLRSRIGEYIPADATPSDCTKDKYPLLLLKCLQIMLSKNFTETKYDKRFVLPLFSTIYQDSQHLMLTFTCVILDSHDEEEKVKACFEDISYVNFKWDEPSLIKIPELTIKEMIEINKLLPGKDVEEQLLREFNFVFDDKAEEASSYISFYKYYPSFQSINF